jgi:hypothetical protein
MLNFLSKMGLLNFDIGWEFLIYTFAISALLIFTSKQFQDNSWIEKDEGKVKKLIESALVIYLLWALLQQFLVLLVYNYILVNFFPSLYCIAIASFIFTCLHYPNVFLMLAVLALEPLNLMYFNFYHNIYVLALNHSILANVLYYFYPSSLHKDFKVLFSWSWQK